MSLESSPIAMAQAIPTYAMGCFLLPKGLLKDLEGMMTKFWWGQKIQERKVHWLGWSKLCMPKSMGGPGIRDLHSFNIAMLAKQGRRLMKNTHPLFYRVYKSKYFPNTSFLDAPSPTLGSFAWKSIVAARSILDSGLRWRVGTGNKIRI